MSAKAWLLLLICVPAMAAGKPDRVDFATQIRPILDRCQPCHFEGGKLYGKYPFDRPDTVHLLGERLFTRIKDERERTLIRAFLAQGREIRGRKEP